MIACKAVWCSVHMVNITAVSFNLSQVAESVSGCFLNYAVGISAFTEGLFENYIRQRLGWELNRVPGLSEKMLSLFSFPFVTCGVIIRWQLLLQYW